MTPDCAGNDGLNFACDGMNPLPVFWPSPTTISSLHRGSDGPAVGRPRGPGRVAFGRPAGGMDSYYEMLSVTKDSTTEELTNST